MPARGYDFYFRVFEDFRRFFKILRSLSEVDTNVSYHFPKMSEDVRRHSKITEGCGIFPINLRGCFDHI